MEFNKNYLQLDKTQGSFYVYSKEEKDGYKKHESTTGKVSYRKYFDKGVTGKLDSVTIYESDYGKQISMSIVNDNEQYYAPVEIFDQRGNVNLYAESLIKFLPLLEKQQSIVLYPYRFIPEGSTYSKAGVSITINGEKQKSAVTNSYYTKEGELVAGDIPAVKWVEKLGKKSPSAASLEAKDDYLLAMLETAVERLTWKTGTSNNDSSAQPKQEDTPKKETPALQEEEDYDDLPF